jgi:SPASM domain peptide maturase of grasp-with-spasm system
VKFLSLFACCILVKGAKRSLIVDTQRNSYYLVPNTLLELFNETNALEVGKLHNEYNDDLDVLKQYMNFLLDNELVFWTDNPENFPKLEMKFESPERITNAIIDVGENTTIDFAAVSEQLDTLKCKSLQLRINFPATLKYVKYMLSIFNTSVLRTIDVFVKYSELEWDDSSKTGLAEEFSRLSILYLYGSRWDKITKNRKYNFTVIHLKAVLEFPRCCGVVHPDYFAKNLEHVVESNEFNSCLNKKISIDHNGNIKNCPSMSRSFGNIANISLADVVIMEEFRKLWNINKNQISTCKDCEFRHVCTDCRAYLEEPDNIFSKPLKCGYDPYRATWEIWSENPLKKNTFKYYEKIDFS